MEEEPEEVTLIKTLQAATCIRPLTKTITHNGPQFLLTLMQAITEEQLQAFMLPNPTHTIQLMDQAPIHVAAPFTHIHNSEIRHLSIPIALQELVVTLANIPEHHTMGFLTTALMLDNMHHQCHPRVATRDNLQVHKWECNRLVHNIVV